MAYNRNITSCHKHIKQAMRYAEQADMDYYADCLLDEGGEVIRKFEELAAALVKWEAGVVSDQISIAENRNLRHKVEWVKPYIGVVK